MKKNKNKLPKLKEVQRTVDHGVFENGILEWKAPAFKRHERGLIWYILAIGVLLTLVGYAIYTRSWTMALAFLVFAGVYYQFALEEPEEISIKLSYMGIKAGKNVYPFSHVRTFWITYEPHLRKSLHLYVKGKTFKEVVLELGEQDPAPVRDHLASYAPEWTGRERGLTEVLVDVFKL